MNVLHYWEPITAETRRSYLDNISGLRQGVVCCISSSLQGRTSGEKQGLDLVPDEIWRAKSKLIINAAQVGNMQRESRNKFRSKKRKNLSMINGSSIFSTDLNVYKQTGNKFILTPQKSAVCHNQVSVIYHLLSLFLNYSKIHEEGSKRFREFKMCCNVDEAHLVV